MFWLRNKKIIFPVGIVIWGPEKIHNSIYQKVVNILTKTVGAILCCNIFCLSGYSKTCVKQPLKIDKTKKNGSLLQVKSIAEWSILQYF